MKSNLSIWQRVLRLVLTEKGYVLRRLRNDRKMLEATVANFEAQVNDAHLAIASTIENVRRSEANQVAYEERNMLLGVKIEGVSADFKQLQNRRKHQQAAEKSDLLEELIEEQITLEKNMANNAENIKQQTLRIRTLRRTHTELKSTLQAKRDQLNNLISRYEAAQAMDKATSTLMLLESGNHEEDMRSYEQNIRKQEAAVESRMEVRESSESRMFERLEHDEDVQKRLAQHISTPQKGIE